MKKTQIFSALALLCALGISLLISCEKEAETLLSAPAPHAVVADRQLTGTELDAYLDWATNLDSNLVINLQETDSTLMDTVFEEAGPVIEGDGGGTALGLVLRPKLYCVYTVAGVQGGMCGGMPPAGGTICINCNNVWPQGGCPNFNGKQLNCWPGGNVVCTMTVVASLGFACDRCPVGGYTTEVMQ
jgi:hypothetical protein